MVPDHCKLIVELQRLPGHHNFAIRLHDDVACGDIADTAVIAGHFGCRIKGTD